MYAVAVLWKADAATSINHNNPVSKNTHKQIYFDSHDVKFSDTYVCKNKYTFYTWSDLWVYLHVCKYTRVRIRIHTLTFT